MSVIVTPGSASANSYASETDYTTYWGARLFNTTALAATGPLITAGLIWSRVLMDAILLWTGAAVDEVQALSWPRTGMRTRNGFEIGTTVIPVDLKNAQCEYAGILQAGDRTADDPSLKVIGSETSLTSVKAGSVALTWQATNFQTIEQFDAYVRSLGPEMAYLSKAMPDSVRNMIPPSWYKRGSVGRRILFGAF